MGGRSEPAYVESMPIPTINKAMASVDAAVAKTFATAVQLYIPIFPSRIGVEGDDSNGDPGGDEAVFNATPGSFWTNVKVGRLQSAGSLILK